MAENDQRAYRDLRRGAEEARRAASDDPLAELARLIGQSAPMKTARDRRPAAHQTDRAQLDRPTRYATSDEVPQEPPAGPEPMAPEYGRYEQDFDSDFRAGRDERYESAARANSLRASRFRQERDFATEGAGDAADVPDDAPYQAAADWHGRSSDAHDDRYRDEHAEQYADEYETDEYENEADDAEDHGYGEHGENLHTGRRGGFVFVAAVFALAVLGTAGAFTYRAMFGAPAIPALPPIIKAEGGPNKIIPSGSNSPENATRQADATNARSGERLVPREERPVDIPPPVTGTAPRPVATVPVFPDPPAIGGPGAIVGYSPGPASNPAISPEPPTPAARAINTATVPAPSSGQVSPSAMPPPGANGMASTPPPPGPKKIRTVTIHGDESGAPDGNAARSGAQAPQASNAPLSIVPSSTEAPAAPARPRPAPVQSVPVSKPPANEAASAAPTATATTPATSGGYTVQVSSQRSEAEAQSSFRDLQAKYPSILGSRQPIIRRADLGAKGIYFRAMVGPFASADQATELCSNLKAAGGTCIVQKN